MNTLKIKEIRMEKGMTAAKLSDLSGLSKSYISELEHGKYEPTVLVACQICKGLKVTPNELINEELWMLKE